MDRGVNGWFGVGGGGRGGMKRKRKSGMNIRGPWEKSGMNVRAPWGAGAWVVACSRASTLNSQLFGNERHGAGCSGNGLERGRSSHLGLLENDENFGGFFLPETCEKVSS